MSVATLIAKTVPDLSRIVGATEHALGTNVARCVDEGPPRHPTAEFMAVLESMSQSNIPLDFFEHHVSVSVLIALDTDDYLDVATMFSGMSVVTVPLRRGMLLVATGTLHQWQSAVEYALHPLTDDNIREVFSAVLYAFENDKLRMWAHLDRSFDSQNNIFLEAK